MKTKMNMTALLPLHALVLFTSCEKIKGKGDVVTETRTTSTYSSVNLQMSATIYFEQDSVYSLQISGQENIIDQVETKVEGSQLVVDVKSGVILGNHDPIKVYITAPAITGFTINSSGDIVANSSWNTGKASLDISGSGNISLSSVVSTQLSATISGSGSISMASVKTDQLTATISGSGDIYAAAGSATREDLKISGSGTIDLRNVTSPTIFTTTSGSGEMYVYATGSLDVTISGSGNVWYYGTPSINTHISGSGNIKKL